MYDYMAKRQKICESDGSDRISFLPKPVLHHILSFVETPQVVRTCVLSKTWKNIWRSIPTLDFFRINEYTADRLDLVKFIDSLLFLRDGVNIKKLILPLRGKGNDVGKANGWIIYAMRHNVEVLEIRNAVHQAIPLNHILNSESLTEFTLSSTDLNLPAVSISLPVLRILKFFNVNDKDGQLEVLISASPSLETLLLESCAFKNPNLTISSTQLKNFYINGGIPSSVVISTPNLVSLKFEISNEKPATMTFDCDLLSLSDAMIGTVDICSQSRSQLFSAIKNARSLILREYFFRPLVQELQKDDPSLNCIQIPFYNLKSLELATQFEADELASVNNILKNSPQIESVVLVNKAWFKHGTEAVLPKYKFSHLKFVELQDFRGFKNEVNMIKILLENAIVLEKLVIRVRKDSNRSSKKKQKLTNLGNKLLTFPRASASVGILYVQNW